MRTYHASGLSGEIGGAMSRHAFQRMEEIVTTRLHEEKERNKSTKETL